MSITPEGVKFEKSRNKKGVALFVLVTILEGVFSFFLYLAIAGRIFSPDPTEAAPGVPALISYQGRLTDASGNPLGGTGTIYCFRYSIYDAASGGGKVWPTGTPTNSTTTVIDGTFNDQIGRMDPINFDLFGTSTLYLNVDVNTATSTCGGAWETLSPRQQITASGFALAAEDIYGNYISTVVSTSTKIQIGAGGGVTSGQILLSLAVKNVADNLGASCTDNGSLWYNSANSRALICENGTIQTISNSSTTISGIATNAGTPITGNLVFADANGVSFGQNGSTITASVNAGGNLATYLTYQNRQLGASSTVAPGQNSVWMVPFRVPAAAAISGSSIQLIQALSGTATSAVAATFGETIRWGIYSNNTTNSTRLDTWATGSLTLQIWNSGTSSGSYAYNGATSSSAGTGVLAQAYGTRMLNINLNSSLQPGLYVMAFALSTSSAGYNALVSRSHMVMDAPMPLAMGLNFGAATATSIGYVDAGTYGTTSGAMPTSVGLSQIKQISNFVPYFKIGAL